MSVKSLRTLVLVTVLAFLAAAQSAEADVVARKRILRHFPGEALCQFRGQYDLWFVATAGQATIMFEELANDRDPSVTEPLQIDRIDVIQIDEDVFSDNYKAEPSAAQSPDCWTDEAGEMGGAPFFDLAAAENPPVYTDLFNFAAGWTLVNAEIANGSLRLGLDPGAPTRAAVTVFGLEPGRRYYVLGWSRSWEADTGGITVAVDAPRPAAFFLQDGRFRLEVRYGPSQQRAGGEVLTAKSAAFWFGDPAKVELVASVADRCADAGAFWLSVGGTTTVLTRVTVIDTATGRRVTYQGPRNVPFQTRIDKTTFRCP